jgi:hypothetical protein
MSEGIRASDAERDAVVDRVRDAAAEGRLTFEELADRVEAATSARTRAELDVLVADLPAPETLPSPRTGADLGPPVRQSSVFGDVRRTGRWVVPSRGTWKTLFGDVVLDLRDAQVGAEEIHVEAETVFGDIDVLVPEGVVVEVRARVFFGDIRQKAAEAGPPGAPRIVLTGGTIFGDVKIRSERLRERLAARLRGA